MKGWGTQDDFQAQIAQTVDDGIARARAEMTGSGATYCACGDEISEKRRKALPYTTRCISCQVNFEIRGQQFLLS